MKATLYWAATCAPSKMLVATLDQMMAKGDLPGLEVNIIDLAEDRPAFVAAGVRATPTLIIEREAGPVVLIGAISRAKLLAEVSS